MHYVDVDRPENPDSDIPLVLVHGAGSSHLTWALTLREFETAHRMIAIDLSGHGYSEHPGGPASIDGTYLNELRGLIDHLELERFVLVGHSMGGAVALSYVLANDCPRPNGLVLVGAAPQLELSGLLVGLAKEVIDQRIKYPRVEDNPDALLIKQYEAQVMTFKPQIMQRDLAACRNFNVIDRLSEVDIPSFVLVGEGDDVTPPTAAKALTDGLPRADLAVIRNADHVPMLEAPDEFHRLLRKYLEWAKKNQQQL